MSNAAPAARDARPKPGGTSMGPILLGVAAVALLAGAVTAWPRTVDDSFITYRYAENLAHGQGAIFNPGERVEGYSSPSWMLLLAAAIAAGLDPETVSKALGLISSLLLLWLVYRALRRAGVSGAGAGLAAISLGASYVFQLWSVAGLETNAYALLFFAGLALLAEPGLTPRTSLPASATLAAAALTRPEGIAFWGLGLALVALTKHPARMRSVGLYLLPGLAIGAHLLWRTSYYGNLLPNTYYAKTGGGAALWTQGWTELRDFALTAAHGPWIVAAAWGAVVATRLPEQRRRVVVWGGAALLHAIYLVSVGGDGLFIHRFFVPLLPLLAALSGLLFLPEPGRRQVPATRGAVAFAVLAIATVGSLWSLSRWAGGTGREVNLFYQEGNTRLGRALAAMSRRPLLVAAAAAGAIPYYSKLPTIDMYGLNDAHIAHGPFPEQGRDRLLKWDNDYVLSRQPDLIVINRGYFRAGDPSGDAPAKDAGFMAVTAMDRDLFRKVMASGKYALTRVPFPDGASFWVLVRVGETPAAGGAASTPH